MGFFSSIGKIVGKGLGVVNSALGSPLGQVGTNLVTGALSSKGLADQNIASIASAREAAQFNAEEAQKNRDFLQSETDDSNAFNKHEARLVRAANARQARISRKWLATMSNSAHTREIRDLKRAGLNPILSAKYGGASTPPGPTATAGSGASSVTTSGATASRSPARIVDEIGPALSTAAQVSRTMQDIQNMTSQNAVIRAEAERVKADTGRLESAKKLNEAQEFTEQARRDSLIASGERDSARGAYTRKEMTRLEQSIEMAKEELKRARNQGEVESTTFGKIMRYLDRLSGPVNSAVSLYRPFSFRR
mgnify:CR=1 FL=1